MTKDVAVKVKKMVVDHLGVEEAKVTDEANFIDDLGLVYVLMWSMIEFAHRVVKSLRALLRKS